jgi:hypothetical protein
MYYRAIPGKNTIMLGHKIREVKDSHHPAIRTNAYSLTPARNDAIVTSFMWQPAHAPIHTVYPSAINPSLILIKTILLGDKGIVYSGTD